ncbi:hypothetical protein ROLI_011280 [Roseobacter fucihabitans]|uniref:Uncharacterized protein n=1 Tax=Roseobacter fucihabitans TaxID=1537242 RepID=A0ABZ2BPX1_9RHOB|nr:transporter substrate-binding protein [Roseobacter litoralis]MBC6967107.1 hypothetical protein [Roseobacter litoralis]
MAISETTLKATILISKQNTAGDDLGCQIEAVVVNPVSDWSLFAEKTRELLTVREVGVIFGNWTSVSRKSVLPLINEVNKVPRTPAKQEQEPQPTNRRSQPSIQHLQRSVSRYSPFGHGIRLTAHHKQRYRSELPFPQLHAFWPF